MTGAPQNNYTLSCFAENATVELFINGAPTALHASLEKMVWSWPVPDFLRDGTNRIDIAYEPINVAERNYTPNPDVRIQMELKQEGMPAAVLFNASYDMEQGRLAPRPKTIFGGNPVQGNVGSISRPRVGPEEPYVMEFGFGKGTRPEYSRMLGVEFQVDDPSLRDVAWAGTEPLTDTPEMRDALWQAMARLHQAVERKDRAAFVEIARPFLSRLAYMLGRPDAATMADFLFGKVAWASDEAGGMRPLLSREEAQKVALHFGSDRRLVCFADYQVAALDRDGDFLSMLPVYFARQPGGPFLVCFSRDMA
ncbi:hypothetical protein JMM59_18885 [Rhodovulum sulfidophilum]|uniref:hypothetical protein n=1 Tax=Rhodovulum sulfidophilum TaxID=35806 RepID=UPI001922CA8A|nr:hypothetical protein [Rhodovulum sulfidophilum]MBL3567062.1 hypothetical protein [Rhodovulum sulfidophilum]